MTGAAAGGDVMLVPMEAAAFAAFVARVIPAYAEAMARGGEWPADEALSRSRADLGRRLPEGPRTPGHELLRIVPGRGGRPAAGIPSGDLWLHHRMEAGARVCAVLDLYLPPEARGEGYGRAALLAAEDRARRSGAVAMRVTVLGENVPARSLYDRVGYRVLNARLGKGLDTTEGSLGPGPADPRADTQANPQANTQGSRKGRAT